MSRQKTYYKIEKTHGTNCSVCGGDMSEEVRRLHLMYKWRNSPPLVREELGLKYIRRKDIDISIEHHVPTSRGGTSTIENLRIAHRSCNWEKDNKLPEELEPYVK